MNTRNAALVVLMISTVLFAVEARAGRPITKEADGFVKEVNISDKGFVLIKTGDAEYKIPGDKTLTIKKSGKVIMASEVKVGSKVHMNQMKQDGQIVYTLLDINS